MELFIAEVSLGQKVKLARIAARLRQVDIASRANCTVADVAYLEHDRFIRPSVRDRILAALGFE